MFDTLLSSWTGTQALFFGTGLFVFTLVGLYVWALPRPIPGIPYNKHAARHLLGDVPAFQKHIKDTGEMWSWCAEQCHVHKSPIVQCFVRPFAKPWVIISDFRETQDILVRRTGVFDRAAFHKEIASSVTGDVMPAHDTNDEWKRHRKLMNDTMSTTFLRNVFAPQMHEVAQRIMELWGEKSRLADGHPVSVNGDLFRGAMDAIWETTFGSEIGTTRTQVEFLKDLKSVPLPSNSDEAAEIPLADDPEDFLAVLEVTESAKYATQSALPAVGYWIAKHTQRSLRAAIKRKDALVRTRLESAWMKYSDLQASPESLNEKGEDVTSAIELLIKREVLLAQKEGRAPQWDSPIVRDELFGFILAGHETSSTTLCWGVKYLTKHSDVQKKLRETLYEHYNQAFARGEVPSAEEIGRSEIPYLSATIEEIHRCSAVAPAIPRQATTDTEILGHFIPKGAEIFMLTNGPGFVQKAMPIPESQRSVSSRACKVGVWDDSNIDQFMPERWLVPDESVVPGGMRFDARAGPAMPFGAGPRVCFGKKLATIELNIVLTLMVWRFELRPVAERYTSWRSKDGLTHQPSQCYARLAELK